MRDSDAAYEVAETHAKAGGILSAFGLVPAAPDPELNVAELVNDEDVLLALNARNRRLSSFWLTDQGGSPPDPRLAGRSVVILDGEDDFVNMLRHLLGVLGHDSRVVRHEEYAAGALDGADLVIVGPGPGRPARRRRPEDRPAAGRGRRPARRRAAVPRGLPGPPGALPPARLHLAYKDIVFQGTQSPVGIEGRTERVGFYNTFVGRVGDATLPDGRRASRRTRTPATSTWCAGRTTAASSSTPSRSSPSTATTCCTTSSAAAARACRAP